MFKQWSIRNLLKLWSLATLLAIAMIAGIALYSNAIFTETQQTLTAQVLPLENASRQISSIAAAFITRQKQVIASEYAEQLAKLSPRNVLEKRYRQHWQILSLSVLDIKNGQETLADLNSYYQQFLHNDDQIFRQIQLRHTLSKQIEGHGNAIEHLEQQIQNQVEAISGKINLNISRNKRKIRLSLLNKDHQVSDDMMLDRLLSSNQDDIQMLSQSVRLGVLNIVNLTYKLIQFDNPDNLLSIRENDIRQYQAILNVATSQLKQKLLSNPELLVLTQRLESDVQTLLAFVVEGPSSVYQLRLQQLQNEQKLVLSQQDAISTLTQMMEKLDQLSSLVSEQSLDVVTKSGQVAQSARWFIFILSSLMALGMIAFVSSISRRINQPLEGLRQAMHALSLEKFDTRLEVDTDSRSEFSILANDFNVFASNTQDLIAALANAKEALQFREQHISAILNGVPEAILTLTSAGIIQSMNHAAEEVFKAEEKTLIGLNLIRFFVEDEHIDHLADIVNKQQKTKEFAGINFHGEPFFMWLSLSLVSTGDNEFWVCVISDITAWKRTEEKLKTTSSELDTILENAMVGIAFIKNRNLLRVNHKFEELFLCDRNLIEGQSARCLYASEEAFEQLGEQAYAVLTQGENFEGEVELVRQDGSKFWCALSSKAIDPLRPQDGTIWLFDDVTQQHADQQRLTKLASFDSLTGLPNRTVFNDRLEHAIHKAHRNSATLAVFFLDLDHFKNINDSLGHRAGDQLLCEIANRLKSAVREDDTVARLGGDEFTVILEDVHSVQHLAKVAEKILESTSKVFTLDSTEINVSSSIGISLYPADGRNVDILLRNADAAMYHAKKIGRNNFQFYSAEMNAESNQRLAMETSLRRAVEQQELYLQYQPQIDLRSGKIFGAEALLRWNSEQWGMVSPMQFIPILEETGLIVIVGEYVLRQACETYMAMKDQLGEDFVIAVNLSGRQFKGGQLSAYVRQLLNDTGMPACNLELEITESILMEDTELAVTTLNELSKIGVTLAIDDFGTGYSSLAYLKRFPLNVLKVDRSFVSDVTNDADDAAIVDAILAMSRRLQLDVVAEGVETAEQLAFLQVHDCHRVQGYFFSKPLDLDDLMAFVNHDIDVA